MHYTEQNITEFITPFYVKPSPKCYKWVICLLTKHGNYFYVQPCEWVPTENYTNGFFRDPQHKINITEHVVAWKDIDSVPDSISTGKDLIKSKTVFIESSDE